MQIKKRTSWLSRIVLTVWATFLGAWAMAQDGGGDGAKVSVSTSESSSSGTTWYTSPWAWVVGGAVFVLLLVALLNNRGSRKD